MKNKKFRGLNIIVGLICLLAGAFLHSLTPTNKPENPKEPPKLIDIKNAGCDYLTYQNWDGNWNFLHKESCTNNIHVPHIMINIQGLGTIQPPLQKNWFKVSN